MMMMMMMVDGARKSYSKVEEAPAETDVCERVRARVEKKPFQNRRVEQTDIRAAQIGVLGQLFKEKPVALLARTTWRKLTPGQGSWCARESGDASLGSAEV